MSAVLAHSVYPRLDRARGPILFDCNLRFVSDHELLQHFRQREQVRFFPVAEAEQTRRDVIDRILDLEFEFNGESYRFDDHIPWLENPSSDPQWQVSLHQFHYAVGLGMAFHETREPAYLQSWTSLTDSWIATTPVGFIGAEVTGQRVQNWIYAYYYFVINNHWEPLAPTFHRRLLISLHEQVEFLRANLHPARYQRTQELYAIFLAGLVFPEFAAAARWRVFALSSLAEHSLTDLLPDGVQCELSTDIHHMALKHYLNVRRLAAANDITVPPAMDARLRLALDFTAHAHKPDGVVPSLGDGDARGFVDLLLQGYELYGDETWLYVGTRGHHGIAPNTCNRGFDHAGYYFVRSGWGQHEAFADERFLAFDCGRQGAGDNGHFDALNVELAAYGRSLVVDPGRYTYAEQGPTNWHARFRGTAYHNTVQVDGLNQTDYRAGPGAGHEMRGPAPDTQLHRRIAERGFHYLHGSARSHCYDVIQHRHIMLLHGEYWLILDQLQAADTHRYDLRYHLSEQAENHLRVARTHSSWQIDSPQLLVAYACQGDDRFDVEPGYVAYRYGHKHAAPVLRFNRNAATTWFATLLVPWRDLRPQAHLQILPSYAFGAVDQSAFAVQIDSLRDGRSRTDVCMVSSARTGGDWRVGTYRVRGDYLFLSRDGGGAVRRLHAPANASVMENGEYLHHGTQRT